jgi:hypothetical protein
MMEDRGLSAMGSATEDYPRCYPRWGDCRRRKVVCDIVRDGGGWSVWRCSVRPDSGIVDSPESSSPRNDVDVSQQLKGSREDHGVKGLGDNS